jgi:DNA polymerase-3 subunit alpha
MPAFIHLNVHSEYSLANGTVRLSHLIDRCVKLSMPSVAVTDQGNLFAVVKFYRQAITKGVKPIIGVDLMINGQEGNHSRLILLCQNKVGFKNLTRLVSRSYLEGQSFGLPGIQKQWLTDNSQGLIALSGGVQGDIGQALLAANSELAKSHLETWLQLFPGRFYLEIQRIGRHGENAYLEAAEHFAFTHGIPLVASNAVQFLDEDGFEAHEARVCIHEGRILSDTRRPRQFTHQQFLRSPEQMQVLFADLPEALANSIEISKRCNLQLELGKNFLPAFP